MDHDSLINALPFMSGGVHQFLIYHRYQVSLGIKNAFTLWRVEREGLASGFAVVMYVRRRRMIDLSIALEVSTLKLSAQALVSQGRSQPAERPRGYSEVYRVDIHSSSKNEHTTARATPTEKSFPVEQANKILGGLLPIVRDLMNGRSRGK